MTDQELSEILAHPRTRAYIEQVAVEAAMQAIATFPKSAGRRPTVKPAAPGDLTYADAAAFIGCPKDSIRGYVFHGQLDKGALRHTITYASAKRFRRGYCPDLSRRK